MYKFFKIYGQMRTGTNYIASLIKLNFLNTFILVNVGGWKHGNIIKNPSKENMLSRIKKEHKMKYNKELLFKLFNLNAINFIVMIKDPYKWLLSVLKFKKKRIIKENIINELKIWNEKYSNYREHIKNGNVFLIKYEELLIDRNNILNRLKDYFNMRKRFRGYKNINKVLNPNCDHNLGSTGNRIFNKKKFYLSNKKVFSDELLQVINNNIDRELLEFYGYQIIE